MDLQKVAERYDAARQMVSDLCKRRDEPGSRDWTMSIPARPDYDPDLVISASLDDVAALVAEVKRLRRDLAQETSMRERAVAAATSAESRLSNLERSVSQVI